MYPKRLPAQFFQNERGVMPVRDWILSLTAEDRRAVGEQVQVVELGWPLGMPICRALSGYKGLWEIRIRLSGGRAARILFTVHARHMVLLHAFEKKSEKTPLQDLETALRRMKGLAR